MNTWRVKMSGVAPAGARVLGLVLVLALGGCKGGASFPDGDKVEAAQKAWCAMLAELLSPEGQAEDWEDRSACEGTYPTGSAVFVARMTKCFEAQAKREGSSIDPEQLVADCTEQILVDLGSAEMDELKLAEARCERTKRCEQVPVDECQAGFADWAPSERARVTVMYNWGAQDDIASCLASKGCAEDEDAAVIECYEDALAERVWLPDMD